MSAIKFLRNTYAGLLDIVYPPRCLLCEREAEPPICEECYATFMPMPEPACPICGRPLDPLTAPCRLCAEVAGQGRGWSFESARAASIYEGPLRHAIHRLKYNRIEVLGEPLGAHLANRCIADGLWKPEVWRQIDVTIPMPLHRSRMRRRGFNQAELLARPIAEMIGVEVNTRVVRRARRAAPQVGLSLHQRRSNLRENPFVVTDVSAIAGKTVLLVDDVFTTGATADACARALREAGADAVLVATLAAGG